MPELLVVPSIISQNTISIYFLLTQQYSAYMKNIVIPYSNPHSVDIPSAIGDNDTTKAAKNSIISLALGKSRLNVIYIHAAAAIPIKNWLHWKPVPRPGIRNSPISAKKQ